MNRLGENHFEEDTKKLITHSTTCILRIYDYVQTILKPKNIQYTELN